MVFAGMFGQSLTSSSSVGTAAVVTISGGTEGIDYKTHTTINNELYVVFLSVGSYTISQTNDYNYDYFVVGGGGAGGGGDQFFDHFSDSAPPNTGGGSGGQGTDSSGGGGGGGGGGGVKEGSVNKGSGTYTVTVGKGQTLVGSGTGGGFIQSTDINPSGNSIFDTIVSGGGGAGLYLPFSTSPLGNGTNGGNGGGGAGNGSGGTSDTGFDGGRGGTYTAPHYPGGGGGGAGQDGADGIGGSTPGTGGDGKKPTNTNIINAITYWNNNSTPLGEEISNEYWFGGGGGGGNYDTSSPYAPGAAGGKGGGTQGGFVSSSNTTAGLGGSGVVVLVVTNSLSGSGTPVLLTGNDSRFGPGNTSADFVQTNSTHSGTGATAGMVEKSDVSARPNTNGLIMYASSAYGGSVVNWGYLTNLLDTGYENNYTGKWSGSTSQSIVFEFGSSFTFTKVIWKERSYSSSFLDPILDTIQIWNGSSYETISTSQSTTPPTGSNRAHTFTLSGTPNSKYIKMNFVSSNTNYFAIGELEVYGY